MMKGLGFFLFLILGFRAQANDQNLYYHLHQCVGYMEEALKHSHCPAPLKEADNHLQQLTQDFIKNGASKEITDLRSEVVRTRRELMKLDLKDLEKLKKKTHAVSGLEHDNSWEEEILANSKCKK